VEIQNLTFNLTPPGLPNIYIVESQCMQQARDAAGFTTKVTGGFAAGRQVTTTMPVGAGERQQKFYDACMKARMVASGFPNYDRANSQCTQQAKARCRCRRTARQTAGRSSHDSKFTMHA